MDKFGVSSRRPIFRTRNTPNPNGSGIAQSWRGLVCLGLCLGQMLHRRRMPALCQGYQLSGKAWACGALEELIWMSNSASCLTPTLFVCFVCQIWMDHTGGSQLGGKGSPDWEHVCTLGPLLKQLC